MKLSLVIFCSLGAVIGAPSGTQTDSGSSLGSMAASGAAGVLVGLVMAPSPDCKDVGIDRTLCAVLYDEEMCERSNNYLSILPGAQGVLPRINLHTRGLRANDAESLIVRDRCKLELWDKRDGLEKGSPPDLVIDRTPWWNVLGDKYVDELDDDYEEMNEAISAYRCTCRQSMWG
eukprot:GFUD01018724.1.p1 GENE.GFUD01018724.1~~GFUD01018724.1.p1  ORF type:complete len:175 (-),score=41.40 GFUD01018724.1:102-626(-)